MINILSYVGMNLQSEVCLWTLLGLLRTVFDATLFKVNANLKQVWQMSMPEGLSLPVQHVLRTMISGIMLVQCFTVYVFLASYIVLLYPVFLEERPTLVLPWLLLAAIRSLLCELTSLALGLGTCILLGPAKPPCIKFLILKIVAILPVFYMWMLVYSYYHALKLAATFKTFPALSSTTDFDPDYGLELAVRRRRTKSLFGEDQLRKNLVAGLYSEGTDSINPPAIKLDHEVIKQIKGKHSDSSISGNQLDDFQPLSAASNKFTDVNAYEDWLLSETIMPRGSDRILEQFVVMLFRIAAYIKKDGTESINSQIFNTDVNSLWVPRANIEAVDISETPLLVANSKGPTASYIREYPQIFMKKLSSDVGPSDLRQMHNSANTVSLSCQSISHHNRSDGNNKTVDVHTLPTLEEFQQSLNLNFVASEVISPIHLNEINENAKSSNTNKESSKKEDSNNINLDSNHQERLILESPSKIGANASANTILNESFSKTSANTILNEELNGEDQESNVMEVEKNENVVDNSPDAANQ